MGRESIGLHVVTTGTTGPQVRAILEEALAAAGVEADIALTGELRAEGIALSRAELRTLLVGLVRYALRAETDTAGETCRIVRRMVSVLDSRDIELLAGEIRHSLEEHLYWDHAAVAEWRSLTLWLEGQR